MAKKSSQPKKAKKPVQQKKSTTPKRVVVTASSEAKTATKTAAKAPRTRSRKAAPEVVLPFSRKNYMLMLLGVGLIAFGFFLMSLDEFIDASEFSISLYIAPILVVGGFVEIIYAILYRPKAEVSPSNETAVQD
ncbi:MAG: DUF3098 domain-containing protein [Bacteroidota bacterium]